MTGNHYEVIFGQLLCKWNQTCTSGTAWTKAKTKQLPESKSKWRDMTSSENYSHLRGLLRNYVVPLPLVKPEYMR